MIGEKFSRPAGDSSLPPDLKNCNRFDDRHTRSSTVGPGVRGPGVGFGVYDTKKSLDCKTQP